jgi:acyl-CoA thioesterase-2
MISARNVAREAAKTVMSGPASGVIAAAYTGRRAGFPSLVTYDMGGTSTDVALIRDAEPAVGFAAQVLCHRPAPGVEHHQDAPADAGRPEDARPVDLGLIPWETRIVGDTDLDDRRAQAAELALWMRVADRALGDDPSIHQALLAFASELTLIGTALLPHGEWSQLDAHVALRTSVIGHHVLFHRQFRLDDWLLIAQTSPIASGGSAYGTGHVYDIDGTLVASFSQQSMIRIVEAAS